MDGITPQTNIPLRELARRIAGRAKLLVGVALTLFAVVAVWTFTAAPRYSSSALLRIENRNSGGGMLDQLQSLPGIGLAGLARDELETEVGVLRSRRITDAALDSFALTVRVREPLDGRKFVLLHSRPDTDVSGRITLTRSGDGSYSVAATNLVGAGPPPASVAVGDTLHIGGIDIGLVSTLGQQGPSRFVFDLLPHFKARSRFDKRLDVRRQEGGSRLVLVEFEDEDRFLAADVVARMIDVYMRDARQNEQRDAASQVSEIRREADDQRGRLTEAEERLRVFQQTSHILAPEEQATQQVKRLAVLNGNLDQLTIERRSLAKLLELVRPRAQGGHDPVAYRQLATFPTLISNRGIQDVLLALITLENERAKLSVRRTEENDELRQVTARVSELEGQLNTIGDQYLESLDQQMTTASQQIQTVSDTMLTLPAQEMQFVRLVRDRTIANETYILLLKQLKQAELQDAVRLQRVRIVDSPMVASADNPVFPKPLVQLLLGALVACAAALALGLALELWSGQR